MSEGRTRDVPQRLVHTADALAWLAEHSPLERSSLVASLPDISEFPGWSVADWSRWFCETARLILEKTPEEGVTLFFQSDIKRDGVWIDKGYLVARAAEGQGSALLFHKIFCRAAPGSATFGKPSYSHLLAFSKRARPDLARSTADVVPDLGDKTWVRGMGIQACRVACEFIRSETDTRTVVNPFCGHGSVLAMANYLGLDAIGIERSPKRAEAARGMRVAAGGNAFEASPGLRDSEGDA